MTLVLVFKYQIKEAQMTEIATIIRGTKVKTKLAEVITITGHRQLRGKYYYTFEDEHNSKGFITRDNLLDAINNDGAKIL